ATGVAKGTPAYMSPEQAAAEEVDGRADLWSLGAILYQLATGEPLLQGRTVIELMMQLLQLPQRLQHPEALAAVEQGVPGLAHIVGHLLQSDPDARYRSAAAVEADLIELLPTLPSAPSLRAVVRDLLSGGDGLQLAAMTTRPVLGRLGLSVTIDRPTPTNIEADGSSFVGRAADVEQLTELFEESRLVTLLGMGGTGKTRLAREFGLSYLDQVAQGGAWFVPLDEARGLDGILHSVGRALEIPLGKGSSEQQLDQIGAGLAARRGLLLVLDNFEQVAALAPKTVGRWLGMAPKLRVLVTSRELLRVEGERVHPVGPLSETAAVQLFIDRARSARASFKPSDDDRATIREIVTRLDAIPLALELAASRISVLPPKKLLDRLSQRFRLLRGGQRGTSSRQRTLEGAIAWSWDLLTEPERWTLAWCSTFHGGFTLEQAEEVIDLSHFDDGPWVLDTVEALMDKSLLRTRDGRTGEPRFGMFESIREFAAARLAELGVEREARDKHAAGILRLGEELAPDTAGPEAPRVHRRIDEELENFAAAYAHAAATDDWTTAGRLVLGMEPVLRRRGPAEYFARVTDEVHSHEDALAPALLARVKYALAVSQRQRGRARESIKTAWGSVRIAEDAGDAFLAATHAPGLGYALQGPDGADEAIARLREARAYAKSIGDRSLEGHVLSSLALALGWAGDAKGERLCHNQALDLHRAVGNQRMAAADAGNIAIQHAIDGELEESEQWMLEAYEGFKESYDPHALQLTLGNLAALYVELDRRDEAERALRRAIDGARKMGIVHFIPVLTSNYGQLRTLNGDYEGAEALFWEVKQLYEGDLQPIPYHESMLQTFWGVRDLLAGDPEGARDRLAEGVTGYKKARMGRDVGIALGLLAAAQATCMDEEGAVAALDEARSLADELDSDDIRLLVGFGEGHVELLRAKQARASGETEDAFLLEELADARLDMLGLETLRPALVRLGRRMLELAVGRRPTV
ncbi:MAG: hypothetical protein KDA24_22575, partial [Deltaproteobacteria bacterium]|nr:hypothetical protein [Deltaproteobacteria bacterium]